MVLNRVVVSMLAVVTIAAGGLGAQGGGRGAASDSAVLRVRARIDSLTQRLRPSILLYGLALECTKCNQFWVLHPDSVFLRRLRGDSARLPNEPLGAFTIYNEWPCVTALAPGGAAERAGIQVDDSLVAVNGESILRPEGARRFGLARPGDDVTLTLRRGGRNVDVTMTLSAPDLAGVRLGGGGRVGRGGRAGRGAPPADALPLRFSGNVGATPVEVMSDSPLTVEMEPSGDLVIHVAGSTVRVHPSGPRPGRPE